MLTSSVMREFTTHADIITSPLKCRIEGRLCHAARHRALGLLDATSLRARDRQAASVLVVVSMKVSLTDRQGRVLYQAPRSREQYESFGAWRLAAFQHSRRILRVPWFQHPG